MKADYTTEGYVLLRGCGAEDDPFYAEVYDRLNDVEKKLWPEPAYWAKTPSSRSPT